MKKNIIKLLILTIFISLPAYCEEITPSLNTQETYKHTKPTKKDIKQIDKMLETRLNLSQEQIKILRANKQKNIKEIEKSISKMESLHKKIRDIYMLGIPKYQADLKSAPYKMELVVHKQNIDKIRSQNKRNFEAILTPEQKAEFKKIQSEMPKRPHNDKFKNRYNK